MKGLIYFIRVPTITPLGSNLSADAHRVAEGNASKEEADAKPQWGFSKILVDIKE